MTLKLKNVNFGLKSRALTLPCAVATTEEIFAVAKDLLKTEVDNVSPQPLRLRLMGNLALCPLLEFSLELLVKIT